MKKILNIIKYILLFALSMFMMGYALKGIDFERVLYEIRNINYLWIAVSLLVAVAGFFSRAYRWKMQITPTGYKPSLADVYHAMMVGYLANLVLPRAGEVIRCSILKRTDKIPVNVSLGTVITERVIDLVLLFTMITITFFVEFDKLHNYFMFLLNDKYSSLENNLTAIYVVAGLLFSVSVIGLILFLTYLNQIREHNLYIKVTGFIKGILQGIFSIRKIDKKGEFVFHTLFVWVTYFLMSYTAFFAMPGTSHLDWHAGLAILVIGGLGMAAPVQGGIGVFHIMVQTTLLFYGISKDTGIAYALVVHTTQTLLVVLMGGISFLISMLKTRRAHTPATELHFTAAQHEIGR